jgi:hypothetical protein
MDQPWFWTTNAPLEVCQESIWRIMCNAVSSTPNVVENTICAVVREAMKSRYGSTATATTPTATTPAEAEDEEAPTFQNWFQLALELNRRFMFNNVKYAYVPQTHHKLQVEDKGPHFGPFPGTLFF